MGQIRGFFRADFSTFWLGEPKWTEICSEKVPGFVPFKAHLTYFEAKSDIPVFRCSFNDFTVPLDMNDAADSLPPHHTPCPVSSYPVPSASMTSCAAPSPLMTSYTASPAHVTSCPPINTARLKPFRQRHSKTVVSWRWTIGSVENCG